MDCAAGCRAFALSRAGNFVSAAAMKLPVLLLAVALCGCTKHEFPPPGVPLTTEILVADLKRSIEFYEKLGFVTTLTEKAFAELKFGGHKLFLSQSPNKPHLAEPTANVRIPVRDVDRYWRIALEMKARVVTPIGDRSYKERDFLIADPDGFGLRFASLLPGGHW
jgi:catechol 2,3-dioxygenase-like lactoylglutathione lyase family enzyme